MGKRVVLHTGSLGGGGAERVTVLMANALAARGHDVTLLTWNAEGPNRRLLGEAVKLVDFGLPLRGEGFGKPRTIAGLWRTARHLHRLRPEVVFSAPEFANLVMTLALLLAGSRAKFIPSFHAAAALRSDDFGAQLAILLSKLVASRASRAIAVSAGVAREIAVRGYRAEKVVVIHNPVPPPVPGPGTPRPWRTALAASGPGPVIVTAGRLAEVKDHQTLISAFARLRQARPARLLIFGEGPLDKALRAHAEALGVGDHVVFAGYVADPAACYADADLFVLSSTSEGFGNVLVEAMAAGVPVVSTDAPYGPREILADGRFGALVPVGDADALAEAMARMLDHPTSTEALRQRAADFAIDRIADAYAALVDPPKRGRAVTAGAASPLPRTAE
jgi:glycosyltransferase involved in cell wall biosynthesis